MKLEFLADNKAAIPIVASWYYKEWGSLSKGNTLAKVTEELHGYLNTDKIPLMLLAVENGVIIGVCQLKYREMSIYPEKEHCLGGVYVSENHRGRKIAEKMISGIISVSISLNVQKLYLQTERLDGGLYKNLGWQAIERVNYRGVEVLVMENEN